MKRLNRKGFTLIELLTVIVVLALIIGISIPFIVNTVKDARQEAYEDALTIIEKYVNEEYTKCRMDPDSIEDYNSDVFVNERGECQLIDSEDSYNAILTVTKYKDDIESLAFEYNEEDEEYQIILAPVLSSGKFKGVETRGNFTPGVIPPIPKPFNPIK